MRIEITIGVAMLLIGALAYAEEDCGRAANEQAIQVCLLNNYTEADAALNAVYSELTKILLDPSELRKAQRAWVSYRDSDCKYVTSSDKSHMDWGWFRSCATKKTLLRTEELEEYLGVAKSECSQCPSLKE